MYETDDDLQALQRLLDDSFAVAGPHAREITGEKRLTAEQVVAELQGMKLLVVATVTADGRPITGPVDAFFYRGRFHFGSSPESVKIKHIRARPEVSATHLPGEPLSISVHGTAEIIDPNAPEHAEFRSVLVGNYGEEWASMMLAGGAPYARITAARMLTFSMPPEPD